MLRPEKYDLLSLDFTIALSHHISLGLPSCKYDSLGFHVRRTICGHVFCRLRHEKYGLACLYFDIFHLAYSSDYQLVHCLVYRS